MARCSACVTGMTFTESNIALSFGGKCKNCIIMDNPKQKDKLQNKTTKQQDTIMNRITLILATVLSLAFTQVTAQDLGKGLDAYAAGDYATALKEWKPLAEIGNADAQSLLAFLYKDGNGVLKDATEAAKWMRLAAEQGDADAQYFLAVMYYKGEGVLKDSTEEIKWYRLSAEQGNAYAQFSLGHMYRDGEGVLKDNQTAHMWYNIASANGHESAGEHRDKLAALMTDSGIEKATAMARECMKSDYEKCGD